MTHRVRIIRHDVSQPGINEHNAIMNNMDTTIRFHPNQNPIEKELERYRALPGLACVVGSGGQTLDDILDLWKAWASASIESFASLANDIINEKFRRTVRYDCEPIEMRIRDANNRMEQGLKTWRDMKHKTIKHKSSLEEKVKAAQQLFDVAMDKLENLPQLDPLLKPQRDIFVRSVQTLYDEAHQARNDYELRQESENHNRLLNIIKTVGYDDEIKGYCKDLADLNKEVVMTKQDTDDMEKTFVEKSTKECDEMRRIFIERIYTPLIQSLGQTIIDPVKDFSNLRSLHDIREHMINVLEKIENSNNAAAVRKTADAQFVAQELTKAKSHFEDLRQKAMTILSHSNQHQQHHVVTQSLNQANDEIKRLSNEVVLAIQHRAVGDVVNNLKKAIVMCQGLVSRQKEIAQFYKTLQNDIKRTYVYSLRMMQRARCNAIVGKKHEANRNIQSTMSTTTNPGDLQLNQLNESRCAEQNRSTDLQFFAKLSEVVALQTKLYEHILQLKRAQNIDMLCDDTITILQNVLETYR